jgi:hypothetical protein
MSAAISLARDGFGAHLLDVGRIRMMESETFRQNGLQRLVVITIAVALRRGDVAVFEVIVLVRNALRPLRFVVDFFRRLGLLARFAHVMPFLPDQSPLLCMSIQSNGMISI